LSPQEVIQAVQTLASFEEVSLLGLPPDVVRFFPHWPGIGHAQTHEPNVLVANTEGVIGVTVVPAGVIKVCCRSGYI
jgi:hypothetical protein